MQMSTSALSNLLLGLVRECDPLGDNTTVLRTQQCPVAYH